MYKNKTTQRDFIVSCSQTNCDKKECPNFSKEYKKNSFSFPSCMFNPNIPSKTANGYK